MEHEYGIILQELGNLRGAFEAAKEKDAADTIKLDMVYKYVLGAKARNRITNTWIALVAGIVGSLMTAYLEKGLGL